MKLVVIFPPTTIPLLEVSFTFLRIKAIGKNATPKTKTPTSASFQELINITAIKLPAPNTLVTIDFICCIKFLAATSGSERYLVKIIPEEFSSKKLESIVTNEENSFILTEFVIFWLVQSVR